MKQALQDIQAALIGEDVIEEDTSGQQSLDAFNE
jgi:hypothetical protein